MAVHKFKDYDQADRAWCEIDEGDFFTYRIPYRGPVSTGDDQHIVCDSEGRAMASCGWEHDAVRIAEALDND